ncbi:MAG: hypothetical protein ACFFB0_13555 [Promethearchaeota archaeon]
MSINEFHRNIILTIFIAIICLFVGLYIIFVFTRLLPVDPVASYLAARGIHNPAEGAYQQMKCQLGFCDSITVQYFKYISDFFTGNWRISVSLYSGTKVTDIFGETIPKTLGLISLPLIIGGGFGFFLGRISSRNRGTGKDKIIQVFSILGISLPIFFLCGIFQYALCYELKICEPTGISALPIEILTFTLTAFITWQVRSYLTNKSYEKSLLLNTIKTGISFSYIFMFWLLVEVTFNIYGFGTILIYAISQYDYFLIRGSLFLIIIMFVIVTISSNLIFSIYMSRRSKSFEYNTEPKFDDTTDKGENSIESNPEENIKEFLRRRLKSPFFILGAILIIFFIFIAIFPQLMTQYSLSETLNPSSDLWNPPSSEHPLGQTVSGLDVYALIIWGIHDSIIVGFLAVLIGLIGGSIFGFIAGKFNRWGYRIIMGLMIFFYIFPGIVLVILLIDSSLLFYGPFYWYGSLFIGILLIPNFTRVIANAISGEINIHKISKAVISQIPLNFAIFIVIYTTVGFLGLYTLYSVLELQNQPIQLGSIVNMGSQILPDAPWASFWPGLTIFGIVLSFLLFHVGLQDYQSKNRIKIE